MSNSRATDDAERRFALPPGHRVYAIGDVHGHDALLGTLLDRIETDLDADPADEVVEVFLGDYIDRGPDSRGVIQRLSTRPSHDRTRICIRGNHEAYVTRFLTDPAILYEWGANGGLTTLASYGVHADPATLDPNRIHREFTAALPRHHEEFLDGLAAAFQLGDVFFTHAGIRPGIPIEEQDPYDLMTIRREFLEDQRPLPVRVIHGHTPSRAPVVTPYRIGVDTGAFASGILTACVLEGSAYRFLSTETV